MKKGFPFYDQKLSDEITKDGQDCLEMLNEIFKNIENNSIYLDDEINEIIANNLLELM